MIQRKGEHHKFSFLDLCFLCCCFFSLNLIQRQKSCFPPIILQVLTGSSWDVLCSGVCTTAIQMHSVNVFNRVGLILKLASGKLPDECFFTLMLLLTERFLEVTGLLLPQFRELHWTIAKEDFNYSPSRCRIDEHPVGTVKDFGDAVLFVMESSLPPDVATSCISPAVSAVHKVPLLSGCSVSAGFFFCCLWLFLNSQMKELEKYMVRSMMWDSDRTVPSFN